MELFAALLQAKLNLISGRKLGEIGAETSGPKLAGWQAGWLEYTSERCELPSLKFEIEGSIDGSVVILSICILIIIMMIIIINWRSVRHDV